MNCVGAVLWCSPSWSLPLSFSWHRIGYGARAAFAQSKSFCTVGAPLSRIAPTTSPFTLMGNPPPHAATRASVGIPAKSDGSLWIKVLRGNAEQSCVCLVLGHLGGRDRAAIHPAKGRISAVVENRFVLFNAKFSWLSPPLRLPFSVLAHEDVFLHYIGHWSPSSTRCLRVFGPPPILSGPPFAM